MRRRLKNMSKIRIAILGLSLVGPANAARVYNLETKRWEEATVKTSSRRGSPIAKAIVEYETKFKAGTIIVETSERRLYLVLEDGKALKYGIGVGREGFTWSGQNKITRMAEWPGWTPPAAMRSCSRTRTSPVIISVTGCST